MTIPDSGQPLVNVEKLSMVGFESAEPERLVEYYEQALGFAVTERADGAAYLTTGPEHHCVTIAAGGTRARTFLGLQIKGSLKDAEQRLRGGGIEVERRSDPQPGVAEALVISEPSATPLFLFEGQSATSTSSSKETRPLCLGHVASFTDDVDRDQSFYVDVLGFRWSDSIEEWFTFLRCDEDHHAVNFMLNPAESGMHHVAYKMRDIVHLKEACDQLAKCDRRLQWGPGRHGPGHNIFTYHQDPDGNLVELFTEIDVVIDEATGQFEPKPWHEDDPQVPKAWPKAPTTANLWGPLDPAMERLGGVRVVDAVDLSVKAGSGPMETSS